MHNIFRKNRDTELIKAQQLVIEYGDKLIKLNKRVMRTDKDIVQTTASLSSEIHNLMEERKAIKKDIDTIFRYGKQLSLATESPEVQDFRDGDIVATFLSAVKRLHEFVFNEEVDYDH